MTVGVGRGRRPRARAVGLIAVLSATSLAIGANVGAQEEDPPDLAAEGLSPVERITGTKSLTSRVAETDPALLGRTDATPVEVVVKLDYDPLATYQGTLPGLEATSPSVTGEPLNVESAAVQAYDAFAADQESAFLDDLAAAVPAAQVGQSLRTVYGGVALTIPANTVESVLALPNVVAVQQDKLNQLTTDSSGEFIGADFVYPDLGGKTQAGAGVIFGVLDTGGWPEHESYADQGNLGAPPPKADGTPRACNFGDNPLTPAVDPFACTNKLIGGQPFLAAYLSNPTRAANEPYHTARDSDGHGTHTGTTTAGNVLGSAEVFGVERGPVAGIAPGAWVSVYKVCGILGCFSSDSAAAVGQAILDGVDVINFSISGGTDPGTDPVEQAFLDAYAAGVFVAASAGNDGPDAATANHLSPWTTTVAASTQTREFRSTLSLTAAGGATFEAFGASITAGVDAPLPVVLSSAAPYSNNLCTLPAAPGTFTGKIVACERGGNARVDKGFNVAAGGAAGMILYNPTLADIETDNHWLPTVHLADGTDFKAFMAANTGVTGTFTAGEKADGQGDVMAAFSSRGPAGNFIKPDITAPGVQILAGHTPTPDQSTAGPPGEYFQAIAGTSMSSPHIAGSAVLMKALKPDWSPGEIKSALMTTAVQNVVKEDNVTTADPFDMGSGRVYLANAELTSLTFDETAANMASLGTDPINAVHLNLASIYAPVFPGKLVTERVATNASDRRLRYDVEVAAPADTEITVSPRRINLAPGDSVKLTITIESTNTEGVQFGEVRLIPRNENYAPQHLTVGFVLQPGAVELTQSCEPTDPTVGENVECTVSATNFAFEDAAIDIETTMNNRFRIVDVDGAVQTGNRSAEFSTTLDPAQLGVPSVDPGELFGYLPLDAFGVTPEPIGDEEIINFNVPSYVYNGVAYTSIGIDSNGYVLAGGGTSEDNECCTLPTGADPAPPNNMLAPFWTDLDGTGAPGVFAATLTDGVDTWVVVEYRVNDFGTTTRRTFQVWIGVNGTQDITYAYVPGSLPTAPVGQDFLVGAENDAGQGEMSETLPTGDLRVTSTDPTPGGSASYGLTLRARQTGLGLVRSDMTTDLVPGVSVARSDIFVFPG